MRTTELLVRKEVVIIGRCRRLLRAGLPSGKFEKSSKKAGCGKRSFFPGVAWRTGVESDGLTAQVKPGAWRQNDFFPHCCGCSGSRGQARGKRSRGVREKSFWPSQNGRKREFAGALHEATGRGLPCLEFCEQWERALKGAVPTAGRFALEDWRCGMRRSISVSY
jgi:hypothetical protein